ALARTSSSQTEAHPVLWTGGWVCVSSFRKDLREASTGRETPFARARFLRIASALGVVLFLVYSANGREIGAGDTVPGILLPVAILRGDGFALERFNRLGWWDPKALPYAVAAKRGHLVSRSPVAHLSLAR